MKASPNLVQYAEKVCDKRQLKFISFEGAGGFKETFKVSNSKGDILALKIFDPTKFNLQRTQREIESIKKCDHQNICKIFEFDNLDIGVSKIHFTLEEFLFGGSLTEKIRTRDIDKKGALTLANTILDCLIHLKELGIVHRDIKPDNIMYRRIGDSNPVLVDFGIVRVLDAQSLTPSYLMQGPGTPIFSSPEQLNNEKSLIDWKTDQFSLGIVLSYCFLGLHPFKKSHENNSHIVQRIANREDPVGEFVEKATNNGMNYIIKMISAWPHRRFQNPDELKQAINN